MQLQCNYISSYNYIVNVILTATVASYLHMITALHSTTDREEREKYLSCLYMEIWKINS